MRIALLLLPVLVMSADAAKRPSFSAPYSAWQATHVIVVDANGAIVESWKGDLKPGGMLALAPLEIPKGEAISYELRGKKKDDPERVSGERTVLFLTRKDKTWKPASLFGGMKVSVAWIEKRRVYAFVQQINPGPSLLIPLGVTEEDLKKLVTKADAVKQDMNKVAAQADPAKRAEAIVRFIDSDIYGPYWDTFEILGGCGNAAVPVCRKLLADPKRAVDNPKARSSIHSHVIEAMVKAAGVEVRGDLITLLEDEQAYWKKTGPTLKMWWGQEPMTNHYSRLHTILHQLAKIGITPEQEKLVAAVRDLWKSLPQLDSIGNSQIAQAAEAVLKKEK
jgi:hypothetical protein